MCPLQTSAVLTLLLLSLSPSFGDKDEAGKRRAYLDALVELYDAVAGQNGVGRELALKQVLAGLLSDEMNRGQSPRNERRLVDMEVVRLEEDGTFQTRLLTDSLAGYWGYSQIEGSVNFQTYSVSVSSTKQLDLSLYTLKQAPRQRDRPSSLLGGKGVDELFVNNGSKGIHELLELADSTKCKKSFFNECERGSVVLDPWTSSSLAFQRWLQGNLTLDLLQTLGTHNSFNNKADGYGRGDFTLGQILQWLSGGRWEFVWAQQWFSMTDQLDMGVRHLMLDPVYFWGKMRLCHCGTTFKWLDDVLHFIEKTLNITIQFSSTDLGCMPYDRTLVAGLQEIYDWVMADGNEGEVVMVLLNDERTSDEWGHLDLIQDPVPQIFGELLFTPLDKASLFPDSWPSPNQLVKLGKRVIMTCTSRCNNSHIFLDMHVPDWDLDTVKYFSAAPQCGGFVPGQFYLVGGESQVVGPIYNGPAEEGLVIRENLPYLMQCAVSVTEMDLVSPALIQSAVWSWSPGYSYENISSTHCPAVDGERKGRWIVLPCSLQLWQMCQRLSNISDVTLSLEKTAWGTTECPTGYVFSRPQTGYVNWNLYHVSTAKYGNSTQIWINLN